MAARCASVWMQRWLRGARLSGCARRSFPGGKEKEAPAEKPESGSRSPRGPVQSGIVAFLHTRPERASYGRSLCQTRDYSVRQAAGACRHCVPTG